MCVCTTGKPAESPTEARAGKRKGTSVQAETERAGWPGTQTFLPKEM